MLNTSISDIYTAIPARQICVKNCVTIELIVIRGVSGTNEVPDHVLNMKDGIRARIHEHRIMYMPKLNEITTLVRSQTITNENRKELVALISIFVWIEEQGNGIIGTRMNKASTWIEKVEGEPVSF